MRALYCQEVMATWLEHAGVLLRDFKHYAVEVTRRIRDASTALAATAGRPVIHLRSWRTRKDELAEQIRRRDRIEEGLIAVFSAVEGCHTWTVRADRQRHALDLQWRESRCTHVYFYFVHPEFGRMHLRLQTWFPFLVHVCLNGREWLARQLGREGIRFTREDNCLPYIADPIRAQQLLDAQARTRFDHALDALIAHYHPQHERFHQLLPLDYYWTVAESEHATDVMFRTRPALQRIYPALVHHSMMSFGAEQVLRFHQRSQIGAKTTIKTDCRRGSDGVRVKHWLNSNSLKLYDKGRVLRAELTINQPADFRVWRKTEGRPDAAKRWQPLRRSVVDLPRRAELGRAATGRQLEALAAVHHDVPLGQAVEALCQPVLRAGRRHRALNPFAPADHALLLAVNRGEFALHGLRNADLRALLYPKPPPELTPRQLASRVSRQLALLRAHRLLARVPHTQRYIITKKGRQLITALLATAQADTQQLTKLAA